MHKSFKKIFLILFAATVFSCNSSSSDGVQLSNDEDIVKYGKSIYTVKCEGCHGANGNANAFGATDLNISKLTETEIGDLVYHGKKSMPPFKEQLGEPEITAVAKYVNTMKVKSESRRVGKK